MMTRGFIPSQSSQSTMIFIDAAKLNVLKTQNMMLAQSPMLLQLHKVKLQNFISWRNTHFHGGYVTWISTALLYCPPLQSQCKSCIISAVGQRYMEKVNKLPLPNPLLGYLQIFGIGFILDVSITELKI